MKKLPLGAPRGAEARCVTPHDRPSRRAHVVAAPRRVGVLRTMKGMVWRAAYRRWPAHAELRDGYTVLLPVPGDLPVFLRLALAVVAAQDPAGKRETLVVPDRMTSAFARALASAKRSSDADAPRLVTIGATGRTMERLTASPAVNYFLQLYYGVAATRTTHALLHDADLFINDPAFLAAHHARCREEGLACLGVEPAWGPWHRERELHHLVATSEMMFDVRWMRSFPPWQHRPHYGKLYGEHHGFDVTDLPQAKTAPRLCALHDPQGRFEHFNWVLGFYREFQQARRPVEDNRFLILLIRLLVDVFSTTEDVPDGSGGHLPTMTQLVRGLRDPTQPVTYLESATAQQYPEFRRKLQRVINGPLFDDDAIAVLENAVQPFDGAFGR
jgi:hypothetical protein